MKATYPFYAIRLLGGLLYLVGHADHGLERLEDRRPSRKPAEAPIPHAGARLKPDMKLHATT